MKKTTPTTLITCPFWNDETISCSVESGGLFIPLSDHIQTYCIADKHQHCLQYGIGLLERADSERFHRINDFNRRRHIRISRDYQVTLVQLRGSGNLALHTPTIAHTIDISMGGMKLLLEKEILEETILKFDFGETYPAPLQNGVGKVQWCSKISGEHIFEAGLALFGGVNSTYLLASH